MKKQILSTLLGLTVALGAAPNTFLVQAETETQDITTEDTTVTPEENEFSKAEESEVTEIESPVETAPESIDDTVEDAQTILEQEEVETSTLSESVFERIQNLIENADRDNAWKSYSMTVLESMEEEDFEDIEEESDEAILAMFDTLVYGEVLPNTTANPYYYIDGTTLYLTQSNDAEYRTYWGSYCINYPLDDTITTIVIKDEISLNSYAKYFSGFSNLTEIQGLDKLKTDEATTLDSMFAYCPKLVSLDLSLFNTENVLSASYMFSGCRNLESIDVTGWDTSGIQNMSSMFNYCENLKSINTTGWNTSNVTNMSRMFSGCERLETLDLSHFSTARVTDMNNMFSYCENLKSVNTMGWNTSNVKNMGQMFSECKSLEALDLSHFTTDSVTDMNNMFASCASLKTLKVSNWNTENVSNMAGMFAYCNALSELNLSNWTIKKPDTTQYYSGTDNMFEDFFTAGYITCPKSGGHHISLKFTVIDDSKNEYTDLSSLTPVKIDVLTPETIIYDPTSNKEPRHGQIFINGPYLYRYFKENDGFKGWTVTFLERYRWNPHLLNEIQSERYLSYNSYRTTKETAVAIQELIIQYLEENNEPLTIAPALNATADELHGENIISLAQLFKVDKRYLNTADWSTEKEYGIHGLASDFTVPETADVTEMFMNAVYLKELPEDFILPDRSDFRGLFANCVRLDPFKNGLRVSNDWKNINPDLGCSFSLSGAIYATTYPHQPDNVINYDAFYNTGLMNGGLTVKDFDSDSLLVHCSNDGSQGGASIGFGSATKLENVTTLFPMSEYHFNLNVSVTYFLLNNPNLLSIKNLTVYDTASGYYERKNVGAIIHGNALLLNTPNLEEIDGLSLGGFDGSLLLSCNENLKDVKNIKLIDTSLQEDGNSASFVLTKEAVRGLFSTTPNVNQIQICIKKTGSTTFEAIFPDLGVINDQLSYDNEQWQWYLNDKPLKDETGNTIELTQEQVDDLSEKKQTLSVKYVNSLTVGGALYDIDGKIPENFILNPPQKQRSLVDYSNADSGIQTFGTGMDYASHNMSYVILQAEYQVQPTIVKIQKTDMDGKPLQDAKLTLTDATGAKTTWTSTKEEPKEFALYKGTYTLTEEVAPQGYEKVTSAMEFTIDNDGVITITKNKENGEEFFVKNNDVLNFKNRKIETENTSTPKKQVPNTSDPSNLTLWSMLLTVSLATLFVSFKTMKNN